LKVESWTLDVRPPRSAFLNSVRRWPSALGYWRPTATLPPAMDDRRLALRPPASDIRSLTSGIGAPRVNHGTHEPHGTAHGTQPAVLSLNRRERRERRDNTALPAGQAFPSGVHLRLWSACPVVPSGDRGKEGGPTEAGSRTDRRERRKRRGATAARRAALIRVHRRLPAVPTPRSCISHISWFPRHPNPSQRRFTPGHRTCTPCQRRFTSCHRGFRPCQPAFLPWNRTCPAAQARFGASHLGFDDCVWGLGFVIWGLTFTIPRSALRVPGFPSALGYWLSAIGYRPVGSAPPRPADSAHGYRSASCSRPCAPTAPAPSGCHTRSPADAWRSCAAAHAA